jgi:exopolysaccharide production protein ExoZ
MGKSKFDTLQVFRGFAALGVVLHHANQSTNAFVQVAPPWIDAIFSKGFLGVDFFFVLSGFIIMSSHFHDEKSSSALARYCRKRFIRVFPPYWPISMTLACLYLAFPLLSAGDRAGFSWISSLFLLPDGSPPALSVAWTLIHELLFYVVFTVFFISGRLLAVLALAWALAISLYAVLGAPVAPAPILKLLVEPLNIEFILGMGVAYLSKAFSGRRFAASLLALGAASFILIASFPISFEHRVMFAAPFSCLVLGAVFLERNARFSTPMFLVRLGDASFSIYLIHNPLLSVTSRMLGYLPFARHWWLGLSVGVASSVLAGVLYHLFVEKPLMAGFQRALDRFGRLAPRLRAITG